MLITSMLSAFLSQGRYYQFFETFERLLQKITLFPREIVPKVIVEEQNCRKLACHARPRIERLTRRRSLVDKLACGILDSSSYYKIFLAFRARKLIPPR